MVDINPPLAISPTSETVASGASQAFSATGGGSGKVFSLATNNSGGSIDSSSGIYTAGTTSGVTDTVQVTDALGNTSSATVSVNPALSLSPLSESVMAGKTQSFAGSGGVGTYTYSLASNNSGGSIDSSTGVYTAGATSGVSDTVSVKDSDGNTVNTTVAVRPLLIISPASAALMVGNSKSFSSSGGVGTRTYSLAVNNSGGSIDSSTGAYTAGATGGVTDTVRVTDDDGNTADASVTVAAALTISPTSASVAVNGTVSYSVTGGVSPYTWSILSGSGSLSATTGTSTTYTAPLASGSATVRVSDSAGNHQDSTVTITGNVWFAASTTGAPSARESFASVWTGSKLIVWGGLSSSGVELNSGGIYDQALDTWSPMTTTGAPDSRYNQGAVWDTVHNQMIVFGGQKLSGAGPGCGGICAVADQGGIYHPATDTWTTFSTTSAPSNRILSSMIWTGSEVVIFGGRDDTSYLATGAIYDPGTDSWTTLSTTSAPGARGQASAIWTGSEVLIWGGTGGGGALSDGAIYDPAGDSWSAISSTGAPAARYDGAAAWNGSDLILYGGHGSAGYVASPMLYVP